MIDVCLLGTGGMVPLKSRFLTGLFAEINGRGVLIDCGEGMQVAFGAHDIKLSKVDVILITHSHADHVAGLPGLLLSVGNCSRTEPLEIYMPASCERIVKGLMCLCENLPYEVRLHALENNTMSFKLPLIDPLLTVNTLSLKHSTECVGYSMILEKKPVFDPDKAKSLNVPVKLWKALHSGESVVLDDGTAVASKDVTKGERPAVKLTYVTDTLPFYDIAKFAENSDLFICEGMYGEPDKKESMNQKRHMLMQDACELAGQAKAKRLWLTHYSPAMDDPGKYENELKTLFANTVISADGQRETFK